MLHGPDGGLNLVGGHMPRSLHHGLDSHLPGPLHQLAQHDELHVLGPVRGVLYAAWPQAVAQREGQVVLPGHFQKVVVLLIVGIVLTGLADVLHGQ